VAKSSKKFTTPPPFFTNQPDRPKAVRSDNF